ncbi:MAG TPA: amidohydrolase [Actinomycetes bacterium]|nr:amidohydrolase [Actinomycetes bacterium]
MSADVVFTGGQVFEGLGVPPRRVDVAVADGRISDVGEPNAIRSLVDKDTEVVDVGDGLLVPGFIDAHVHPVYAGNTMILCELHGIISSDDCVAAVADYASSHPQVEWIVGGGWSMEGFPGGNPTRQLLDAVVPDRPVYLPNRDGHGAWVNSRALELAGIDANTPDPDDGRIEREADGSPSGTLHEGAMSLVSSLIPPPTDADYDRALDVAQQYLLSLGITGWQDAIIGDVNGRPDNLEAYVRASNDGRLKARVVGALWWDRLRGPEQIDELVARRERGRARRFSATSIKVMQDGIAENFTAAMLSPYLDACGDHTANAGISFVDPEALGENVKALDALGFQVHFHAIGDRAVREALDAIEVARTANGDGDHRHHIAHIQVIHPDDISRFAALDVTANMQPLWACHEPQMNELTIPFLGEPRWRTQYPFGALVQAGARLAGGSDWSVSSPDVMWGSHVAVNRSAPPQEAHGEGEEKPFLPDQSIDLATALTAYSQGSAYVNHLDHVTGTIEPGKYADLAVFDRNPFAGPPEEIHAARATSTWIEGERVFTA